PRPDRENRSPRELLRFFIVSPLTGRPQGSPLHYTYLYSAHIPLLRRLPHLDPLHPRGTILELRNLPEWIERRIGEQVGGRLDISERDEPHAVGNPIVLAHRKLDRAAPCADPHHVARRNAEAGDLAARQRRHRGGLERVEHARTARHGAGVPVLELAPSGEHH